MVVLYTGMQMSCWEVHLPSNKAFWHLKYIRVSSKPCLLLMLCFLVAIINECYLTMDYSCYVKMRFQVAEGQYLMIFPYGKHNSRSQSVKNESDFTDKISKVHSVSQMDLKMYVGLIPIWKASLLANGFVICPGFWFIHLQNWLSLKWVEWFWKAIKPKVKIEI